MITYNEHITFKEYISNGIEVNALPYDTAASMNIIHGDIRDLRLHYNKIAVHVITKASVQFMKDWGLQYQLNKLNKNELRFDVYQSDSISTPNTLTVNYNLNALAFKYECNSRHTFETLNQIKNSLLLLQTVNGTQIKPILPTDNIILHYCLQPIQNAGNILTEIKDKNYRIGTILAKLNSNRFRHNLKMIHPSTIWLDE